MAQAMPAALPAAAFSETEEEMEYIRPQDGYFIRDLSRDVVICPAGNTLTKKCTKSNGYTRYMCKAACHRCADFRRCYSGKGKWKEIDFSEGAVVVKCRNWSRGN